MVNGWKDEKLKEIALASVEIGVKCIGLTPPHLLMAYNEITEEEGDEMKLFPHQIEALESAEGFRNVAFYLDMGMG